MNLNERELEAFLKYLDVDGDGEVSPDDFVTFLRYKGDQLADQSTLNTAAIVDIAVSDSPEEESALHTLGYQMLETNLNADTVVTSKCYLWYRRLSQVPAGTPTSPLVDIFLHVTKVSSQGPRTGDQTRLVKRWMIHNITYIMLIPSLSLPKVCSTLVAAGYVCVSRNINRGMFSRTPLYLWIKRAQNEDEAERDAILEVSLTTGRCRNREDKIWFPPSKDYIRVDGNLNERYLGHGVFLWFRPRTKRSLDVQKASPIKKMEVSEQPGR